MHRYLFHETALPKCLFLFVCVINRSSEHCVVDICVSMVLCNICVKQETSLQQDHCHYHNARYILHCQCCYQLGRNFSCTIISE